MISSLELARECGVSQGTVDRALHDRPGVSPKTKERILQLARQRNYRPHPAAREILTGKSLTVGAILPMVNNVFFMDLFNELGRALAERNLRLQIAMVDSTKAFLETLEDFAARRYRLAVAIPPEDDIVVPKEITDAVPFVSLFGPCRGPGVRFISADEETTGRTAVEYLYHRGHRRILHLSYTRQTYAIGARALGYQKQCEEYGLPTKSLINVNERTLINTMLRFKPTALFCLNDWMALRASVLLTETGLRVPRDVSILGVDNSPTLTAIHPGLTSLAYPITKAVELIMRLLAGNKSQLKLAPYVLVERSTVRKLGDPTKNKRL